MINNLVFHYLEEYSSDPDRFDGLPMPRSISSYLRTLPESHGTRLKFFGRPHLRRHTSRRKNILKHLNHYHRNKAIDAFNKKHMEKVL